MAVAGKYEVEQVPVGEIIVGERLRGDLGDLAELMESIRALGLLHPITVEPDGRTLVAGRRRLEAVSRLGHTHIAVHRQEQGDPLDAEYQENTARLAFTPAELTAAEEYFRRRVAGRGKPAEYAVAAETGHSRSTLRRMTTIRRAAEGDPDPLVREVAQAELDGLRGKTKGAHQALNRVQAARRVARAEAAGLLPGQQVTSKARSVPGLADQLWKVIGDGSTPQMARLAGELRGADVSEIPDSALRRMRTLLSGHRREVYALDKELRNILDERRYSGKH